MLLEVNHLRIAFKRQGRITVPVRDVSFSVPEHGRVALVGESGCGKSLTALSLARLPPTDRAQLSGEILFTPSSANRTIEQSEQLEQSNNRTIEQSNNRTIEQSEQSNNHRIAYVFQNPSDSLNPVMRIAEQIREALPKGMARAAQDTRIVELLARTGLPDPVRAAHAYPCELSGGQQQRAMIAMALAAAPDLLVADEPTTALDVTTQKQVLELIDSLAAETGMAVLLITHNLGLVAGRMDFVNVMYAGQIVESGPVTEVLSSPRHPYTKGLLAAVPALDAPRDAPLADIPGVVPPPDAWPSGCAFHPRCACATDRCRAEAPLVQISGSRTCVCFQEEKT